jgi:hypothetical protein
MLEGYVYLKCAEVETFNETSATVVVNLDGTSNHSYALSHTELTVKPVEKSEKLVDAVVGPSTLGSDSTAGTLSVDVTCPVTGTVWV